MAISNKVMPKQVEGFMLVQDLMKLCLSKWYLFVISLIITVGLAVFYSLKTPPEYTRATTIIIKDNNNGQSISSELSSQFSKLGLIQASTNVGNEITFLRSQSFMSEVVKRLNLSVSYYTDGKLYKELLYATTLPVNISFLDLSDHESASLDLKFLEDGKVEISNIRRNKKEIEGEICLAEFNDTVQTSLGRLLLTPTDYYTTAYVESMSIERFRHNNIVSDFLEKLIVTSGENTTIIRMSIEDRNIQRAEDILNTLISVYNENWIRDRNQMSVSTSMFIDERLDVIERELGVVDEDISSYKSANLLTNVDQVASMYMTQANQYNLDATKINTQITLLNRVRRFVEDNANEYKLLPANVGSGASLVERQITEYNSILLRRNTMIANSSESNPLVDDLDQRLEVLKTTILFAIDNELEILNTKLKIVQQQEKDSKVQVAVNPSQEKYLLSVERQQKVKESLYLFLLQKREENELSQAFTAYNTRIVNPPVGSMKPTSPLYLKIIILAFVVGLLLPLIIVYFSEILDTKVRSRQDVKILSIPYVGEIPLADNNKSILSFKNRRNNNTEYKLVVKEKNRDYINEAFRVVRTNIEFILGKKNSPHVIMLTSLDPASGKTFVSSNLAMAFAINGNKVLSVDLDLRHASLSQYVSSPEVGISNYLAGQTDDLSKLIVKGQLHSNLDVLPVGFIPPNPTELLTLVEMECFINSAKENYDIIILDCPPINIVADTSILSKYADLTLFVICAGLMDKRHLSDVEDCYTENLYNNLSVVLNCTTGMHGYYGKYGYTYYYHEK